MLSVLLIMLCSGLLGATISTGLSDNGRTWLAWRWSAVTGVGAALLVPLFLQTVSSRLLADLLGATPAHGAVLRVRRILPAGGHLLQALHHEPVRAGAAGGEGGRAAGGGGAFRSPRACHPGGRQKTRDVALAAVDGAPRAERGPGCAGEGGAAGDGRTGGARAGWGGSLAHAFGERAEAQARRLEARIKAVRGRAGWCTVALRVVATDPRRPLEGTVQFFLHPTFSNYTPTVPVQDGVAELSLTSWGAFTVGALCDGGQNRLELDLAAHPDAPEPWRSR